MDPLPEPEMTRRDRLRKLMLAALARFRGEDPETGETDYWGRGGLAGMLGMDPWYNAPPQEIAMGFAGSTTPKVGKAIRAYHGSPHDFDKFDLSKIGTGEGAQSFGHGLYFAENEGVARSYRLAGQPAYMNSRVDQIARSAYDAALKSGAADPVAAARAHLWEKRQGITSPALLREMDDAMNNMTELTAPGKRGNMYEVQINSDPERFLDWDKPLNAQPARENLIQAMKERGFPADERGVPLWAERNPQGESIAASLAGAKGDAYASELLKNNGVPGIRYLDQGSRNPGFSSLTPAQLDARMEALRSDIASGGGNQAKMRDQLAGLERERETYKNLTHNYVVFDDSLISILRKYGLAGLIGGGAAAEALPMPESMR